jgi:hypothetical protein
MYRELDLDKIHQERLVYKKGEDIPEVELRAIYNRAEREIESLPQPPNTKLLVATYEHDLPDGKSAIHFEWYWLDMPGV